MALVTFRTIKFIYFYYTETEWVVMALLGLYTRRKLHIFITETQGLSCHIQDIELSKNYFINSRNMWGGQAAFRFIPETKGHQ